MSITIRVHKKTERVLIDVRNQTKLHRKGIIKAFSEIGQLVGDETKRIIESGSRTGRLYKFNGRSHVASAFGEAPADRSGKLKKSYRYMRNGSSSMRVGETASYAKFLEDGTRRMKPRQHLILAINNKSGDAVRAFYRYGSEAIK